MSDRDIKVGGPLWVCGRRFRIDEICTTRDFDGRDFEGSLRLDVRARRWIDPESDDEMNKIDKATRSIQGWSAAMEKATTATMTLAANTRRPTMLSELRAMNLDRIDMDDAVAAYAFGQSVVSTYESMTLEAPEWLVDKVESLKSYIETRRRENLERALKEIEAEENKLKTAAEKREELAARRKAIKSALGKE